MSSEQSKLIQNEVFQFQDKEILILKNIDLIKERENGL